MRFKYTSDAQVVFVIDDDGLCRKTMLAENVPQGSVIEAADPPRPLTKDELDEAEARGYAKLQAIRAMSPNEVGAWVDANVNTLAAAKDAIRTLAMAVCILSRRI